MIKNLTAVQNPADLEIVISFSHIILIGIPDCPSENNNSVITVNYYRP